MFVAVDFTLKNHLQSKLYDILSLFFTVVLVTVSVDIKLNSYL